MLTTMYVVQLCKKKETIENGLTYLISFYVDSLRSKYEILYIRSLSFVFTFFSLIALSVFCHSFIFHRFSSLDKSFTRVTLVKRQNMPRLFVV